MDEDERLFRHARVEECEAAAATAETTLWVAAVDSGNG